MKTLITAGLLLLTMGATAEPHEKRKKGGEHGFGHGDFAQQLFIRLDRNEDELIDQEEFSANPRLERAAPEQKEALFNRLDKDDDGYIKRDELKHPKGSGPREEPLWLKHGPVRFEQFSQQPRIQRFSVETQQKIFDRIDINDDGLLSEADIKIRQDSHPKKHSEGPLSRMILDKDRDGKLSFAEFQNAPLRSGLSEDEAKDRFESLDKDGDGLLSHEERKSFHSKSP